MELGYATDRQNQTCYLLMHGRCRYLEMIGDHFWSWVLRYVCAFFQQVHQVILGYVVDHFSYSLYLTTSFLEWIHLFLSYNYSLSFFALLIHNFFGPRYSIENKNQTQSMHLDQVRFRQMLTFYRSPLKLDLTICFHLLILNLQSLQDLLFISFYLILFLQPT